MRFSNTAFLFLGSLAGSFFPRGVQAFTDLGAGNCVDCDGIPFSYIDMGGTSSPRDIVCEFQCLACAGLITGADLLGFHFTESGYSCHCLFNNNLGDIDISTPCGTLIARDGTGEICGTDSSSDGPCYSLVDAVPSSAPSDQPSREPSSMPSDEPASEPSGLVIVNTLNGINMSGEDDEEESGMRRSLQSTSDLVIAFEILIQAICSNSDCSDAETLGNQVYEQATGDLQDALSDGTFLNALSSDINASANIAAILSNDANLPPTATFEDVIIPFLERYPSLAPSGTPSCSPSASPTEKPSTANGVNLFYPKWMQGNEGCRNDGDEPDYMVVDPNQWLSSSLEACCKRWFSVYGYESCIGKYPTDIDDCVQLLYYPDWEGSNKGCVGDGQEPYYMLGNANYFLSNSLEECCNKFYPWDLYGCMGTTPTFTNGDFYPDWEGKSNTCLSNSDDEGVVPDYMLMNQMYYLSTTLEKCCERHFFWNINKCLGSSPDSSVSGTNKWYVKWVDSACVQDCEGEGALSCGGFANTWDKLYNSKEECCEKRLSWLRLGACISK